MLILIDQMAIKGRNPRPSSADVSGCEVSPSPESTFADDRGKQLNVDRAVGQIHERFGKCCSSPFARVGWTDEVWSRQCALSWARNELSEWRDGQCHWVDMDVGRSITENGGLLRLPK